MYHVFKNLNGQISILKSSNNPRFERVLLFNRKHAELEVQVDDIDVSRFTSVDIVGGEVIYRDEE